MELKIVNIERPDDTNVIIGQTHFIKTVEDIYEACVNTNPNMKFGIGFCEASGDCLVRFDGNDEELKQIASKNAFAIGAGHSFFLIIRNGFPINVLNTIQNVPEVCHIYAATANPLQVIIAETELGRGIMGVIDGSAPKGIEDEKGINWRKSFLRKIGYKF